MKILKVVGAVAGVHALAFLVIFASPGCSSSKGQSTPPPAPAKSDAPAPGAAPAAISMPAAAPAPAPGPASDTASSIRYSPTRPGTPAAAALETEPVTGVTPATTYTVVSRDSLSVIAKRNHLKVSELLEANKLHAGATLPVGQKLIIPSKPGSASAAPAETAPAMGGASAAAIAPAAGPAKAPGESIKYTVKPGETLGAIARKYGVKVGDIAKANTISDPAKIHPGQELIIPGRLGPREPLGRGQGRQGPGHRPGGARVRAGRGSRPGSGGRSRPGARSGGRPRGE